MTPITPTLPDVAFAQVVKYMLYTGFIVGFASLVSLVVKTVYYKLMGQTRTREMPHGWFDRFVETQEKFTAATMEMAQEQHYVAANLKENTELIKALMRMIETQQQKDERRFRQL